MARTLRGRLARTLGVTAALSVVATALIAFGLVRRYAEQNAMRELTLRVDAVAREAESIDLSEVRVLRRLLQTSGDLVAFVGPAGGVETRDEAMREVVSAIDLAGVLEGGRDQGVVRTEAGAFVYVAVPVTGGRVRTAAIVLARPVGLAREAWRPVVLRVLLAGLVAAAIAAVASSVIARRLALPVRRVAAATARVAAGDLSYRVPVEGEDEVADLARRFNAMAAGLAEARRREHEFLASVSHELRTPLTAIRGYAEAIADRAVSGRAVAGAVEVIHGEAARLERLVEDVMDLARLGAGEFRLEIAECDLAHTLREAVKAHAAQAAEAGVALEADSAEPLVATTDAARVRQIVGNLLENALRVTPKGGAVRVAGRRAAGEVVVEVSDSGPGIATADLPHVFERSYLWTRYKGEREVGTGLGLAIVRELAGALGGRVEVESELGRGATFRLRVPAARKGGRR